MYPLLGSSFGFIICYVVSKTYYEKKNKKIYSIPIEYYFAFLGILIGLMTGIAYKKHPPNIYKKLR